MDYRQLTGRGTLPAPLPGRLVAFAVLLVVLSLGYGGWKIASARHPQSIKTSTRTNKLNTVPDERLEDAQNHLRHIQVLLVSIEQKQNRIHNRLGEVSAVLQQNYLDLEHRRINAADQVTQSVLRDAGEALDEVQLAKQSLTGGNR